MEGDTKMKRILLSLATVGALSALITGATFALFSDEAKNEGNTFAAGTVELGEVTTVDCNIGAENLAPGDEGSCDVKITYSGSLEAWIGVKYETHGALFQGAHPLQISLSGGTDVEINGFTVLGKVTDGENAEVTVSYKFPREADNSYRGAEGTVSLTFTAVQAKNNTKIDEDGNEVGPESWN